MTSHGPREQRHLDFVLQFTTDVRHVSGHDNIVADTLSRISAVSATPNIDFKEMALLQSTDPEFNQLAETSLKIVHQPVRDHDSLELICDDSTGTVRPVVPKDMRKSVFLVLHNMSHPGRKATFKLISRRYLKCIKVRWIPLHLSRRYIVPVLVESASHQFDSSRNLGEGPVAVHAARVNY
ncbi:hypothetical protein Pcinc_021478 [Petrolisthes cinctipes]|uniref:Uncharacterized protein n=1 Tax=Petrolisthes cinctipes TaxID=88211 RepID=A0AAE1FFX9_PETCI|nr:hypothetical protein Pcinc_021478 [Petrolisthes cinctipes]